MDVGIHPILDGGIGRLQEIDGGVHNFSILGKKIDQRV